MREMRVDLGRKRNVPTLIQTTLRPVMSKLRGPEELSVPWEEDYDEACERKRPRAGV